MEARRQRPARRCASAAAAAVVAALYLHHIPALPEATGRRMQAAPVLVGRDLFCCPQRWICSPSSSRSHNSSSTNSSRMGQSAGGESHGSVCRGWAAPGHVLRKLPRRVLNNSRFQTSKKRQEVTVPGSGRRATSNGRWDRGAPHRCPCKHYHILPRSCHAAPAARSAGG